MVYDGFRDSLELKNDLEVMPFVLWCTGRTKEGLPTMLIFIDLLWQGHILGSSTINGSV